MFSAILVPLGIRGLAAFQKEEAPSPESLYRAFSPLRLGILGSPVKCDQSPPPTLWMGWGKGRAAPPPPWFPPLDPPFRGAPSKKRNPQGGGTHPPHAGSIAAHFVRLRRGAPWGRVARPTDPGAPFGSRPLQCPPRNLPSAPLRGLPLLKKVAAFGRVWIGSLNAGLRGLRAGR